MNSINPESIFNEYVPLDHINECDPEIQYAQYCHLYKNLLVISGILDYGKDEV
jgi:hypothetical protein